MDIHSPLDALRVIQADVTTCGAGEPGSLGRRVLNACEAGIAAAPPVRLPPVAPPMPYLGPLPDPAELTAQLAAPGILAVLAHNCTVPGRQYLPVGWVHSMATGAAAKWDGPSEPELTPAQRVADRLLKLAFEYESMLRDSLRERNYNPENDDDYVSLRRFLDPLRPPKPATVEELAAMLRIVAEVHAMAGGPGKASATAKLEDDLRAFLPRVPK